MNKILFFIVIALVFVGCEVQQAPEHSSVPSDYYVPSEGRFILEKVQSFDDNGAYSGNRSIFILTDTKTGNEYVGISGVGISELGSHSSGKTHTRDER